MPLDSATLFVHPSSSHIAWISSSQRTLAFTSHKAMHPHSPLIVDILSNKPPMLASYGEAAITNTSAKCELLIATHWSPLLPRPGACWCQLCATLVMSFKVIKSAYHMAYWTLVRVLSNLPSTTSTLSLLLRSYRPRYLYWKCEDQWYPVLTHPWNPIKKSYRFLRALFLCHASCISLRLVFMMDHGSSRWSV